MKPHWEISQKEADACLAATDGARRSTNTSVAAVTLPASLRRRRPVHHDSCQHHQRPGTGLQIAEGWSVELPKDVHDILKNAPTQPGQPPGLHRASPVKAVYGCVLGNGELGR